MIAVDHEGPMGGPCIEVWDAFDVEARGPWFRAFHVSYPGAPYGSPVVGYCSPGGVHRTIAACAADVRRRGHTDPIYRAYRMQPHRALRLIAPQVEVQP